MNYTELIARHVREVHFGGNFAGSSLKEQLADITWQQATRQVDSFNTIAALVYHINYYIAAVIKVLQGGPLDAHDKYSFDLPPIESQDDWEKLLDETWSDAETLAGLIEQLPESRLQEDFADGQYGTWYRNLHGLIEHTHYHVGQLALLRKMVMQGVEG